MSSCKCKEDKYIDYNCYDCLKYEFHSCYIPDDVRDYLNSPHDTKNTKIPNFTYKKDILTWIVKHLGCTRIFWAGHTNIACKYINFWLNEKIKALDTYKSDSYFKNYEEFVKKFYKVVQGYNAYESCTNNIKFLVDDVDDDDNDNEYKRSNTLYKLYGEYDELKKINQWEYEKNKTCDIINKITKLSNDIARKYKKDEEFIKVLKNLRETIKNAEGRYHEFCKTDLKQLNNMVTETEFPSIVHKPPTHKEISKPSDSLEPTTHQALTQHVTENGIGNQSEANVDLQANVRRVQLSSGEQHTQVSRAGTTSEETHLLELSPAPQRPRGSYLGVSHTTRSRHAGDPHEDVYESSLYSSERNGLSSDARSKFIYTAHNSLGEGNTSEGAIAPEEGTQSYLQNIKGALSDTLQNIDPVPVVGISGGMGVLFLLFKYTPVGTFFRGRGYRQRIPTRFDGVYPGFFPGLEGFEEGCYFPNNQINIAYGRE